MIRISHPRPAHGRQNFIGVNFRDGVAEVDQLHPEVEAALLQHGYAIEKDQQVEAPKKKRRGRASDPLPQYEAQHPGSHEAAPSETHVDITIDGEKHHILATPDRSASELLQFAGLSGDTHELALLIDDGTDIETVETITPQDGQQFISVARSATNA